MDYDDNPEGSYDTPEGSYEQPLLAAECKDPSASDVQHDIHVVVDAIGAKMADVDVSAIAGTAAHEAVKIAEKLKKRLKEGGPTTFRRMALFGGAGMTACGLGGIIGQTFHLSPIGAVVQVYIALFGLMVLMLEIQPYVKTNKYELVVEKYCYFLSLVQGRGLFYIFLGSLTLAQWDLMNMIVGSYMLFVGLVTFTAGAHALIKLNACRKVLKDEDEVRNAFEKFDWDHNGCLDMSELKTLVTSLGSEMTPDEMEASMLMMDANSSGKLDFNEFMVWWRGDHASAYLV